MLQYAITKKQSNILSGIMYAAADIEYITEKYGPEEPELQAARRNLDSWLDDATYTGTPAALVNHALSYGSSWRRYIGGESFEKFLRESRKTEITVI